MRRLSGLLVLLLLAFLLGACQETGADPCNPGGALLADDFSGAQNCGWALYSRSGATVEIAEGALTITSSQPGQIWWTNPGREFADSIITVDAQKVSGPDDNAYGVICRYQDALNYYVFLISSDGYYAIGRYVSGSNQIQYLTGGGQYVASEVINQGTGLNQIQAACVGTQLTLTVNGVELASVTDTTFGSGDIGLAASPFQPGTLTVQFTNFRATVP